MILDSHEFASPTWEGIYLTKDARLPFLNGVEKLMFPITTDPIRATVPGEIRAQGAGYRQLGCVMHRTF
jgi:hypothetical protein